MVFLAVLFFVAGLGGSTYHPFGSTMLAEAYPLNRGRTLGLHQTGGAVGSFVGPIVTGFLVFGLGWRPTLILFAAPGLAIAAMLWFSIRPQPHIIEESQHREAQSSLGIGNRTLPLSCS